MKKNKNRTYQQLHVWQDAILYYEGTCKVFSKLPYVYRRVASQQIACTDSIHRNIAEGHCRRSIKEYLQFLYIALGSLGESVSGLNACKAAGQITNQIFEKFDSHAYKLENGLLKLIKGIQEKKENEEWIDTLMVKDLNEIYGKH